MVVLNVEMWTLCCQPYLSQVTIIQFQKPTPEASTVARLNLYSYNSPFTSPSMCSKKRKKSLVLHVSQQQSYNTTWQEVLAHVVAERSWNGVCPDLHVVSKFRKHYQESVLDMKCGFFLSNVVELRRWCPPRNAYNSCKAIVRIVPINLRCDCWTIFFVKQSVFISRKSVQLFSISYLQTDRLCV